MNHPRGEVTSHEADTQVGDAVRVTGGPFADFTGSVIAIDSGRGACR
ncbi:KOW motif-containing protein [Kitasatospora sp. NPDC087861]